MATQRGVVVALAIVVAALIAVGEWSRTRDSAEPTSTAKHTSSIKPPPADLQGPAPRSPPVATMAAPVAAPPIHKIVLRDERDLLSHELAERVRSFLKETRTARGKSAADVAVRILSSGDIRTIDLEDGATVAWDEVAHDAETRAYVALTLDQSAIAVVALTSFDCNVITDPTCRYGMTAYYLATQPPTNAVRNRLQDEINKIVYTEVVGPEGISQGGIPDYMTNDIKWVSM